MTLDELKAELDSVSRELAQAKDAADKAAEAKKAAELAAADAQLAESVAQAELRDAIDARTQLIADIMAAYPDSIVVQAPPPAPEPGTAIAVVEPTPVEDVAVVESLSVPDPAADIPPVEEAAPVAPFPAEAATDVAPEEAAS